MKKITGPFSQIVPLTGLPLQGPISDCSLIVVKEGGILHEDGKILAVDAFDALIRSCPQASVETVPLPSVALPAFIDAHTHICFAGSRSEDYALRLSGLSYLEIAERGGGILDTVAKTRRATQEELTQGIIARCQEMLNWGVATCEVKSGYGLLAKEEIKMLEAIKEASKLTPLTLVSTCLGAHTRPREFETNQAYLNHLTTELLPKARKLTHRLDIFVEKSAFSVEEALPYLQKGLEMEFDITVHADQFTRQGALLAASLKAVSADHLEQSKEEDFKHLAQAGTAAVMLPGATLGLGMPFPPARKALDAGCQVVIASDWNPGSAPMGDLLTQAALLGAAEKLTTAETMAAMTFRAAYPLGLKDRGELSKGKRGDWLGFPCSDYREILYAQGRLRPKDIWIQGKREKG